MADITAQAVNEFRKRTGLGLMECKALLKEADGDLKKAETLAKERGLKNAEKRAGRAATAGRVDVFISPDARLGALLELGCETDFVARNDEFRQAAKELAEHIAQSPDGDTLDQAYFKDASKTVREILIELNARTGENVTLVRKARFQVPGSGRVDYYIHHDAKSGAMVEVHTPDDATAQSDAVKALVKDLALQVVAAKPLCTRRDEMPAATVEEQKRIFIAQAADKPENIREKIATGKLDAWFGENALIDQIFVKDGAKKVKDVVASAGKGIEVARFARFVVGETE
ncbi:MAG: translation elongation factor Ts [Planctomycetota bacterium]|nr:translation elongation factor Ts [Planctomycetota bacterium]